MEHESRPLDPMSETLVLSTTGGVKNIILSGFEMMGPLDTAAFKEAAARAAIQFPQVMSCIRERKVGLRHQLFWQHRPDLPLPWHTSEIEMTDQSTPFPDAFLRHMRPHLDREWNLFEEVAVDYHLGRVAKDHHVFTVMFHHVAGDAGTTTAWGQAVLANYHEIMTGERPAWADQSIAVSSSRKRKVKVRDAGWRGMMEEARESLGRITEKPVLPVGSGQPDDTIQHHVKRVLSREESTLVAKLSAAGGVSPVDLIAACSNMAVDQWNQDAGVAPGLLTTSVSVNMRGRFEGYGAANNSSLIFFRSLPEQRRDRAAFARSLALQRIRHFRKQQDLRFIQNSVRMARATQFLPLHLRRKLVQHVVNRHQFSLAIGFLGVVWPKLVNGKPSTETFLTRSADLTIPEVHGTGYKLLSSTRVTLFVYVFDNRMNLVLSCSGCLFTREESDAFMDLIVNNLLTAAL